MPGGPRRGESATGVPQSFRSKRSKRKEKVTNRRNREGMEDTTSDQGTPHQTTLGEGGRRPLNMCVPDGLPRLPPPPSYILISGTARAVDAPINQVRQRGEGRTQHYMHGGAGLQVNTRLHPWPFLLPVPSLFVSLAFSCIVIVN